MKINLPKHLLWCIGYLAIGSVAIAAGDGESHGLSAKAQVLFTLDRFLSPTLW